MFKNKTEIIVISVLMTTIMSLILGAGFVSCMGRIGPEFDDRIVMGKLKEGSCNMNHMKWGERTTAARTLEDNDRVIVGGACRIVEHGPAEGCVLGYASPEQAEWLETNKDKWGWHEDFTPPITEGVCFWAGHCSETIKRYTQGE